MKTGKRPARHDPRTLAFEHYATAALPTPPAADTDNVHRFNDWLMLANGPDDTVHPGFQGAGDCVWAGADHETMDWLAISGANANLFSGKTALADYSAVTGYVVGDDSTDRGTDVLTALNYRRKTGIVDVHGHRHKIGAYVALEPGNTGHVKEAIHLFDAVGIGFLFPDYAMRQFDQGRPWTLLPGPKPTDGHYVSAIGYDHRYLYVVSWARVQKMSWGFFRALSDEAFGIFSPEFLRAGKSPEGFQLAELQADVAAL